MIIDKIRLVAFDTSQLDLWSRDYCSPAEAENRRAREFQKNLYTAGFAPLFSFEHLIELFGHENQKRRDMRAAFISSLPVIGLINCAKTDTGIGSIADINAIEIKHAFENPKSSAGEVAKLSRDSLIRFASGKDTFSPSSEFWDLLHTHSRQFDERSRYIASVARSEISGDPNVKFSTLLNGKLRDAESRAKKLKSMQAELRKNLITHGDSRIENPSSMASAFLEEVLKDASHTNASAPDFIKNLLLSRGIDMKEISDDATIADVQRLSFARARIDQASDMLGLDTAEVREQVRDVQIPSLTLEALLNRHRQRDLRRRGSDINDGYFFALASYADTTFVDKRTAEAFRRVREVPNFINSIAKAGQYWKAIESLEAA